MGLFTSHQKLNLYIIEFDLETSKIDDPNFNLFTVLLILFPKSKTKNFFHVKGKQKRKWSTINFDSFVSTFFLPFLFSCSLRNDYGFLRMYITEYTQETENSDLVNVTLIGGSSM